MGKYITFALPPDLKKAFIQKCKPIAYSLILRGLIRAFISGQIKITDLEVE